MKDEDEDDDDMTSKTQSVTKAKSSWLPIEISVFFQNLYGKIIKAGVHFRTKHAQLLNVNCNVIG